MKATNRELAIEWWDIISDTVRQTLIGKYYPYRDKSIECYNHREIEEIWSCEKSREESNPGQYQFKRGQKVKCPEGIYSISYFLRGGCVRSIYQPNDKIMIKGIGVYDAVDIKAIENTEAEC